jgi:hypothetical protein
VNRTKEISELAISNANFIRDVRRDGAENIDDWRHLSFVYAAQMYGAGKTRIGREFVKQVCCLLNDNGEAFTQYYPHALLRDILPILKTFSHAKTYHFDLGLLNFNDFVAELCMDHDVSKVVSFGRYLLNECIKNKNPVFFHFDEIGNFTVDDLRALRDSCWFCLKKLTKDQLSTCFPFFFFSGRGAAYTEIGSPVGSHWLILQPLNCEAVKKVLDDSTFRNSLEARYYAQGPVYSDNKAFHFHRDLQPNQLAMLLDFLVCWTGGAPRALLHTSHMLEALHGSHGYLYKSEEGLNEVFNAFVECVNDRSLILYSDLGPVSLRGARELSKDEKKAYDYFMYQNWLGGDGRTSSVPINGIDPSTYLRSFNIFMKDTSKDHMELVVPKFVSSLLAQTADKISFQAVINATSPKPEDVFENSLPIIALMQQNFYSQKLFSGLIPTNLLPSEPITLHAWEGCGPKVSEYGELSDSQIKEIVESKGAKKFPHNLKASKMELFYDLLEIGDIVRLAPKSASFDIVVKVATKHVIEFQFKSGKTKINADKFKKEIKKSVAYKCDDYESLLVVLCASGVHVDPKEYETDKSNIVVYVPTMKELEKFFGKRLLTVFKQSP